jgi:hypothetical protein
MYIHKYVCTYVYTSVDTPIYTYIYTSINIYIKLSTCICIHTHTHTYIHIHIHKHMNRTQHMALVCAARCSSTSYSSTRYTSYQAHCPWVCWHSCQQPSPSCRIPPAPNIHLWLRPGNLLYIPLTRTVENWCLLHAPRGAPHPQERPCRSWADLGIDLSFYWIALRAKGCGTRWQGMLA